MHVWTGSRRPLSLLGRARCGPARSRGIIVARPSPGELALAKEKSGRIATPDASNGPGFTVNEVGVQLLSDSLRKQVFKDVRFPQPPSTSVKRSLQHLEAHQLDTGKASKLEPLDFTLPPLQGLDLDQHFHRLGRDASEPSLSLAKGFADAPLPPLPESWALRSGWTKYYADGSYEHIPDLSGENAVCFDVETMPHYHPYAIMACSASQTAWYSWISPWLLGETAEPMHLIPFGSSDHSRVVVGHNVSYDRSRVLEEYSLHGTENKWIDTMSLHVATHGISSHQRPAWMQYRKAKKEQREKVRESVDCIKQLMTEAEEEAVKAEAGSTKQIEMERLRKDLEDSLPQLAEDDGEAWATDIPDNANRWERMTSANSLVDVAKLHCGIVIDKTTRDDLMVLTREEILSDIHTYLNYCASDVSVTHQVFRVVLPGFLETCPSPVTWAGVMAMGSAFLPVDQEWESYINRAEETYRKLEDAVKGRLEILAEEARAAGAAMVRDDDWLSQLDWTEKKPRKGMNGGQEVQDGEPSVPAWYFEFTAKDPLAEPNVKKFLPLLLRLSVDGNPLIHSTSHGWLSSVPFTTPPIPVPETAYFKLGKASAHKVFAKRFGGLNSVHSELFERLVAGERDDAVDKKVATLAKQVMKKGRIADDAWSEQLDWTPVAPRPMVKLSDSSTAPEMWPKWYWDLMAPKPGEKPKLDITARSRVAPLLLKLKWQGFPLFHSRQHGWTYRVTREAASSHTSRHKVLSFTLEEDARLAEDSDCGYRFYKLPHKAGEEMNVGNPLSKTFVQYASDGVLTSTGDDARAALDMNAQCSYWISARDRVMKQLVVWQANGQGPDMGFEAEGDGKKRGIILPQVVTMGTVTRRAIEKTWLTASNAKKNRVGSELKAMVRAPDGWSIVGADVDSEELWISSAMGDAQFGMHGATAIGWMTLEGTKAAGTDLHSKTASILGISRDQAKVFNYSRIYGAGQKHATLLMLQSNPTLLVEEAQKLVEKLYANTKGQSTRTDRYFGHKFWYGGTESFLFNKLEEIALSDKPLTPALGCGVTRALTKEYLGQTEYLPSRINWVVQSSGVDYLHLLIVAMQYLCKKYDIRARYLISVHDELRYLVREEDRYRAAMALQIANLWTRSLFAFKLGMDDLPQGVAFFSAVDVDKYLRKEVDMPCITPSQSEALPPGESLSIDKVLQATKGGSLWADGRPMSDVDDVEPIGDLDRYVEPDCMMHRSKSPAFLRAQATNELSEIRMLSKAAEANDARAADKVDASLLDLSPSISRPASTDPNLESNRLAKMKPRYTKRQKTSAPKSLQTSVAYSTDAWLEEQARAARWGVDV